MTLPTSAIIEATALFFGLLGSYLMAKKHIMTPICLLISYFCWLVFNAHHSHWISIGGIVLKIWFSIQAFVAWRKDV